MRPRPDPMQRITCLSQLVKAADDGRAVFGWPMSNKRPIPAAFVVCLQGRIIQRAIDNGLYVYEKSQKPKRGPQFWRKGTLMDVFHKEGSIPEPA